MLSGRPFTSKASSESDHLPALKGVSSVHSFCHVQLFATPWTAAHQASLSITNSQSLLELGSIRLVMPSHHLILCRPLSSCPRSFPASGSFPMSRLFTLVPLLPGKSHYFSESQCPGYGCKNPKNLHNCVTSSSPCPGRSAAGQTMS